MIIHHCKKLALIILTVLMTGMSKEVPGQGIGIQRGDDLHTGDFIVPAPYHKQRLQGQFVLPDKYLIESPTIKDKSQLRAVQTLVGQMEDFIGTCLKANGNRNTRRTAVRKQDFGQKKDLFGTIRLLLAPLPVAETKDTVDGKKDSSQIIRNQQGYQLRITSQSLILQAETVQGLFYGWQTLRQILLHTTLKGQKELDCLDVLDYPRYGFRALMLDPARHFLPVADIKEYIKAMAFYKYNYLHLHLTDDQGWRVQIKAFPDLARKGSLGKDPDGRLAPLFYTQAALKDLVAFAARYYVELIPEIDIPGHNTALLTVMPELACFPKKFTLRTAPGVSKDILDGSNPKVYTVYKKILTEVAAIFPCRYFHLGGDEAPLDTWEESKACQGLIHEKGLVDTKGLMAYFLKKNAAVVEKMGKTSLFWYELDVPGYPANSIAYFWRMGLSKKVMQKAAGEGKLLIGAPGEHAYFDYPMSSSKHPYADWMPVTTLKKVYGFNPGYDFADSVRSHIMGVEATIWGEYVPDLKTAYYRTYPRALAMAEAGWSFMPNRDYAHFKKRAEAQLEILKKLGVNFEQPDLSE